jgi:hypothetical protein
MDKEDFVSDSLVKKIIRSFKQIDLVGLQLRISKKLIEQRYWPWQLIEQKHDQ